MRMIRIAAASLALFIVSGRALAQPDVTVQVDQTQLVNLDVPAATFAVGNTAIADVTIVDNDTIFVLGKSFGITNLIALDEAGREVANIQVTVNNQLGRTVVVMRGNAQASYSCAPVCNPIPSQGDAQATFDTLTGQVTVNSKTGTEAAALASNGQTN